MAAEVDEDASPQGIPSDATQAGNHQAQPKQGLQTAPGGTSVANRVKAFEELQAAAGVKFSIAEALDRFQITAEQRDCLAKRCAALQQLYESAKDDLTLQLNEAVQQRDAALADAARQAAKVKALQVGSADSAVSTDPAPGSPPSIRTPGCSPALQAPRMSKAHTNLSSSEDSLAARLREAVQQRDLARQDASQHLQKLDKLQEMMEAGWLVVPEKSDATSMAAAPAPEALSEAEQAQAEQPQAEQPQSIRPQQDSAAMAAQTGAGNGILSRMIASAHFGRNLVQANASSPPISVPTSRPAPSESPVSSLEAAAVLASAADTLSDSQLEALSRQLQAVREQRAHDVDSLLQSISEDLGFHEGLPIAALLILRAALHWGCFQADSTVFFNRVMETVSLQVTRAPDAQLYQPQAVPDAQVESQPDDRASLAYWLSAQVTLLSMLQQSLRPTHRAVPIHASPSASPARRGTLLGATAGALSSMFSRPGTAPCHPQQVDARYPALLFQQQLEEAAQRSFAKLRGNTQEVLKPLLGLFMNATQKQTRRHARRQGKLELGPRELGQQWRDVLAALEALLKVLQAAHMPHAIARQLLQQVFSYLSAQLFNFLMLNEEFCTFDCAEYLGAGLSELEGWVHKAGGQWAGHCLDQLHHIRQAVIFLTLEDKQTKTLEDITQMCPALSLPQLHRIATTYRDDQFGTKTVSQDVLKAIEQLIHGNESLSTDLSASWVDVDKHQPLHLEDLQDVVDLEVACADLPVPPLLSKGLNFAFLHTDLRQAGAVPGSSNS